MAHITVLLHEAVDALNIQPDGVYVDGTFGRGGHSRLILQNLGEQGRLLVLDKDPVAIQAACNLAQQDARLTVIHGGFGDFQAALNKAGLQKIDGALFDLGLSSPQLDEAKRGFSFRFDAPLDMRMDNSQGDTAAQWLNRAKEDEIAAVIREYGEERFAKRIASMIVEYRQKEMIVGTATLAKICEMAVRTREKGQHPATRTFQAIRIWINRELDEIAAMLPQAAGSLKKGGRLVVIAFHSLEDRLVKQFMRKESSLPTLPKWVTVREVDLPQPPLKIVGKAQRPTAQEIAANPRARSAILRVGEKCNAAH